MTQNLTLVIDEAEFRAVANLVRKYNPHAANETLDSLRALVVDLIKTGNRHTERKDSHRYSRTFGFIVSVGYVENNCAYYMVSFDAALLCPDPIAEKSFMGKVSLENFEKGLFP